MHPDVPEWAREVLARELTDASLDAFYVLKDSPLHKMGVGYSARGAYLVRRTLAGGELYRLESPEAAPGRSGRALCARCGTSFRYAHLASRATLHCLACGAVVEPAGGPAVRLEERSTGAGGAVR